MKAVSEVRPGDKFINPFNWNTIMIRDGIPYSVNHYRAGKVVGGKYKPERVEMRYAVRTAKEFDQLKIDYVKEGIAIVK